MFGSVYILFVIKVIYISYIRKRSFDFRFLILFFLVSAVFFLIIAFINYLYAKAGLFMIKRLKNTVSISHNYIECRFSVVRKRACFDSIKKIELLNEGNVPKTIKFIFETDNIKGIKVISKKTLFNTGLMLLYNIENFDNFIQELKTRLPYHLAQNIK